jgi:hypothetical protein
MFACGTAAKLLARQADMQNLQTHTHAYTISAMLKSMRARARTHARAHTHTHEFDVHVTVHRVKFLIIKPTRWTNFPYLFLEWKSTCFGQFLCPSSGADSMRVGSGWNCSSILILLATCQHICMTYTIVICTVKNSWWWTEELSETCRVSFQE